MDTKAKRAAALGYGLSFLLVLPPADGSLDIPDAGHALNAYRYDMPAALVGPEDLVNISAVFRRTVTASMVFRRTVDIDLER